MARLVIQYSKQGSEIGFSSQCCQLKDMIVKELGKSHCFHITKFTILVMGQYLCVSITLLLWVRKKWLTLLQKMTGTPLAVAAIYKQIEMTLERF